MLNNIYIQIRLIVFFLVVSISNPVLFAQNARNFFLKAETDHLENIRDCTISPDGCEVYFTHQKPDFSYSVIYKMIRTNGVWSKPVKASFCDRYRYLEPSFSPDGLRLYFVTDRPCETKEKTDFDIWYLERGDLSEKWSEPIHPDASFNSLADEFYPSVCLNGDLYFTSNRQGTKGEDDIFVARYVNGVYQDPVSLPDSINSPGTEYNAYISPDGSFILFGAYKRSDGVGSGDLYFSKAMENGNWSRAENLGEAVNSIYMEYCPWIDWTGRTLYFTGKLMQTKPGNPKYNKKQAEKFPGGRSYLFSISMDEVPLLKGIK